MIGPGEVLGVLVVVVFKKGRRVVLCAIDHAGLQGAEDLAGGHADTIAAHVVDGLDKYRVALDADFHALEVGNFAHGLLGVQVAGSAIHPGQRDHVEVGVGDFIQHLLANFTVDDFAHVGLVAEHERQVERIGFRHDRPEDAQADTGHLYGAGLELLDHLFLGAQYATGKHLEGNIAVALGLKLLAHFLLSDHRRITGGVNLGEFYFDFGLGHA